MDNSATSILLRTISLEDTLFYSVLGDYLEGSGLKGHEPGDWDEIGVYCGIYYRLQWQGLGRRGN